MGSRHHDLSWQYPCRITGIPVKPGDKTVITIKSLQAGATVTMLNGAEVLTPKPLTADEKGNLTIPLTVPADAATGLHPLTAITQNPASVSQVMLKLSQIVPPKNIEAFRLQTVPVGERAYQSAVSANGKLFVTSARGPKDGSRLMRLNAGTLAVEAEATLPKDKKGEQIGVFGVGVDNAHNHVWTTNTLAETVTVYDAKTLSVVKVFPEGSVAHPRDVIIDEAHNRAYVSAALTGFIEVYDTKTLEHIGQIEFVVSVAATCLTIPILPSIVLVRNSMASAAIRPGWAGLISKRARVRR
jgi:hypothetical protein